jgi:hypothetical protein
MRINKNKRNSRVLGLAGIAAACSLGLMTARAARADTVSWATWENATSLNAGISPASSALATIASSPVVNVSYSGEVEQVVADYPSWQPPTSYAGGTVGNAPPQSGGIVRLFGGDGTGTDTLTFSQAIVNPVMAIWSLGAGGNTAQFDFDDPFTIEAGGPSIEYGGSTITADGNVVYGAEGNGTIQFDGTFTSLSWTTPVYENWYGFTVGIDGVSVPLAGSFPMAALGLVSLVGWYGMKSFRNRQTA